MTGNQIAAEANAIRKEELAETVRHNEKQEAIEQAKNDITAVHNANMEQLEWERNDITERLGMIDNEIKKSQGDKRLELEAEKLELEKRLAEVETQLKNAQADKEAAQAFSYREGVSETRRHNLASEEIQSKANVIKEHEVDITEASEYGRTPKGKSQISANYAQLGKVSSPMGLVTYSAARAADNLELTQINNQSRSDASKNENKPKGGTTIISGHSHSDGKF